MADMNYKVERFLIISLITSLIFSIVLIIPIAFIITLLEKSVGNTIMIFFLLFLFIVYIMLRIPAYNIKKLGAKIESEVAVTGRRLLIQLESGKSLVNSLIEIGSKSGKGSSKSLEKIAYELYMGKSLEDTIDKAIRDSPSRTFKKIFIQIRNSLRTGADLKHTLKSTLEDITRAKVIEFNEFKNKLNPAGLFYMIFGTILPSMGVVIFVIILTILRIKITYPVLIMFLLFVLIVQMLFISVFTRLRPSLEL